jgi:hypothetical protein
VISTKNTSLQPPDHLEGCARDWWVAMTEAFGGFEQEPNSLSLLTGAAIQLQRAEQARQVIDTEGISFRDRFGFPKERPEVVTERAALNLHRLLCRELGLPAAPEEEYRIPRVTRR